MSESDVVAAIVAGDPDALAEAYHRYAARLYAHCRLMLPEPDAADVVRDTFVIAISRLGELRDPDKLGPWLHAVARRECLRRNAGPPPPLDDTTPDVPLPPGLREQVLTACTDSTPTGRAYRAGAAYRAGPFNRAGFPKAPGPAGPPWWRGVRRHPRIAVAVAAAMATAAAAWVIPALAFSGSHQAATFALGGGVPAKVSIHAAPSPGASTPAVPSSGRAVTPSSRASSPTAGPGPTVGAGPSDPVLAGSTVSAGTQVPPPPAPAPAFSSPSAPPPPPPPPPPPVSLGALTAAPTQLVLVPSHGNTARGTFVLTAVGGPVSNIAITVPKNLARQVKVSPASGSLPAGAQLQVTVTVTSNTPVDAAITVNPGALTVTVQSSAPA